jgi:thiol-disulfide isomerase/thioredoxin
MFLKSHTVFHYCFILFCVTLFNSNVYSQRKIHVGNWNGQLQLTDETILPFRLEVQKNKKAYVFSIHNAEEKIVLNATETNQDSLKIDFPNFHSTLIFKVNSKKEMSGYWANYNKGANYKIPFKATLDNSTISENSPTFDFSGKWKSTFDPGTEDESLAIGLFKTVGSKITGTFLTETGDYRFLEGTVQANSFTLSCFDGSHAFHFTGKLDSTHKIQGKFYSGKHFQGTWIGENNPTFELRNPDSLTYQVKKEIFGFKLKDLEGKDFVFPNSTYTNKVTIVQIMGTWCPNCMDETEFFNQLYGKYHTKGLEIIAVGYETPTDFEGQVAKIKRLQTRHQLNFTFLVGGNASKGLASSQFSSLNQIMSFPTAIIIGKDGEVKRIHTGFNGPGTGDLYQNYVKEMDAFIQTLLQ